MEIRSILECNKRVRRLYGYYLGILTGMACLMLIPLVADGRLSDYYYQIIAGDRAFGCYESSEEATKELNKVRNKLEETCHGSALTTINCSVEPVKKVRKTSSLYSVEEDLYQLLEANLEEKVQEAYNIRVNDYVVTVVSQGAVIETLEIVKNKYDINDCYDVAVVCTGDALIGEVVLELVSGSNMKNLQSLGFDQEIQVSVIHVASNEIVTPVSAAGALTKEWETPSVYTVVKGDCLSAIAMEHGMETKELAQLNTIDDPDEINIGDEIIVTVPKPELSVWYKLRDSYEEEYKKETQYIDNSSWYIGTEKVIQEGTTGKRHVVADILYRDGEEVEREILEEEIIAESLPRIIERGTSTPPTYIKPLVGGRFSSPFGSRWGRMHKGVDWACSVGTTIKASSGGTIASAGWVNGYGYCITISHPDGKKTRYAHLSKILVSSGERVKQGEKIALSGNTGNSTGPHLHFEIFVDGVQVNPLKYLE